MLTMHIHPLYFLAITLVPLVSFSQTDRELAREYYETGETSYLSGQYSDALNKLDRCLKLDPGIYDAYLTRARVKEKQSNWLGAVIDYSIFLEHDPNNKEAILSRGIARFQAGQFEAAIHDFNQFLRMKDHGETNLILYRQDMITGGTDRIMTAQGNIQDIIYNYLGLSYHKLNENKIASQYFDSAIQINAKESDYYLHRGLAKQADEDLEGAHRDYEKVLELNPDHPLAHHNLGVLLRLKNEISDESISQLNRAIENNPDLPYSYLERAYLHIVHGNFQEAIEDYNIAITLKKDDAESWVNRGMAKEKLKDIEGAYSDFSEAIKIDEDYEKAWFCRANILAKLERYTEAIEDYTVALLYYPEYTLALYNRALAYNHINEREKACDDLLKAESLGFKINVRFRQKVCGTAH